MSVHEAALTENINPETFRRHHIKYKAAKEAGETYEPIQNYNHSKVFPSGLEEKLEEYTQDCSSLGYGLSLELCCVTAYETALENNLPIPQNWKDHKRASYDWIYGFLKRHTKLSIRKPEACSLSRGTTFNRHTVGIFYDNVENVLQRHPSFADGSRLFNLDETGSKTSVNTPPLVVAPKGKKQVHQNTSAERGTLVTTCLFVSALGVVYPPCMVFPRVKFNPKMLDGCYPGTLGLVNPSGWMTADNFLLVLKRFVELTNTSPGNPSALFLDNHDSHLDIDVVKYAKKNGVALVTLPPHTTHKLQPLNKAGFGPFQRAYEKSMNTWMRLHPGQTATIYEVAQLVNSAIVEGVTPQNIQAGFRSCGIFPFNRDVYTDADFATSAITDRLDPSLSVTEVPSVQKTRQATGNEGCPETPRSRVPRRSQEQIEADVYDPGEVFSGRPSRALVPAGVKTKAARKELVGPDQCLGLPKAGPRKDVPGRKGRKRGRSMIVTDTPNKNQLEEEQRNKKKRRVVSNEKPKRAGRKLALENDPDDFETNSASENAASGRGQTEKIKKPKMKAKSANKYDWPPLSRNPTEGDLVLAFRKEMLPEDAAQFHVGKIIGNVENKSGRSTLDISYLRTSEKSHNAFVILSVPDLSTIALENNVAILPNPVINGTKRYTNVYRFHYDFKGVFVV